MTLCLSRGVADCWKLFSAEAATTQASAATSAAERAVAVAGSARPAEARPLQQPQPSESLQWQVHPDQEELTRKTSQECADETQSVMLCCGVRDAPVSKSSKTMLVLWSSAPWKCSSGCASNAGASSRSMLWRLTDRHLRSNPVMTWAC